MGSSPFFVREYVDDTVTYYDGYADGHFCWDGTNLWQGISNAKTTGYMLKYTPVSDTVTTDELLNMTDSEVQPYDTICDGADTMWIAGAYANDGGASCNSNPCQFVSLWKYTISTGADLYYSGDGEICADSATGSHIVAGFDATTASNKYGTDQIWGTMNNGSLFVFDTTATTFYPITIDDCGASLCKTYGIDTDGNNLFVLSGIDATNGTVYAFHKDVTLDCDTDGAPACETPCAWESIEHDELDSDTNAAEYTASSGEQLQDLVYDGSGGTKYLWVSGNDGSNSCIWRFTLTYTGDDVTTIGSIEKNCSTDGNSSYTVQGISVSSDFVAAAVEGTAAGTAGFIIYDRTTDTVHTVIGSNTFPFQETRWVATETNLDRSGYLYVTGWDPTDDANDYWRILEVPLEYLTNYGVDLKGVNVP